MRTSVLAIITLVSASLFAGGTITGKVNYKGPAGKPVENKMTPECKKENGGKVVMNDATVINSNNTVQWAMVSLKDAKAPAGDVGGPVVFDQKGCMYSPHVFGIRVNQPLKILNSDPFLHNVNAMPKLSPKFNNGMPTKGSTIEKKFTKAEMAVRIKCDVHPWMNSYANVFDHPYFSVTDNTGTYKIANVPAGDYTVELWHEKLGTKTEKVKVTEGGTATLDFTVGSAGG